MTRGSVFLASGLRLVTDATYHNKIDHMKHGYTSTRKQSTAISFVNLFWLFTLLYLGRSIVIHYRNRGKCPTIPNSKSFLSSPQHSMWMDRFILATIKRYSDSSLFQVVSSPWSITYGTLNKVARFHLHHKTSSLPTANSSNFITSKQLCTVKSFRKNMIGFNGV